MKQLKARACVLRFISSVDVVVVIGVGVVGVGVVVAVVKSVSKQLEVLMRLKSAKSGCKQEWKDEEMEDDCRGGERLPRSHPHLDGEELRDGEWELKREVTKG